MILSEQAKAELKWWADYVTTSNNVLSRPTALYTVTTQGWGAVYSAQRTGGFWSSGENQYQYINYLEHCWDKNPFVGLSAVPTLGL